ncbi:MAG TPA: hypothetical protein VNJ01_00730 [Bacteriovoracaceae bacterium]|nr:hypothetical protein [Bacteriovoracaceae bacterium]
MRTLLSTAFLLASFSVFSSDSLSDLSVDLASSRYDTYTCKSSDSKITVELAHPYGSQQVAVVFKEHPVLVAYGETFKRANLQTYKELPFGITVTKDHLEPYALEITIAEMLLNFEPFKNQKDGLMILKMRDEYTSNNYRTPVVSNVLKISLICKFKKFYP